MTGHSDQATTIEKGQDMNLKQSPLKLHFLFFFLTNANLGGRNELAVKNKMETWSPSSTAVTF